MKSNSLPDKDGHFGIFGGRYVSETLMPLIIQVEKAYAKTRYDTKFKSQLKYYQKNYIGRPSPLWEAKQLAKHWGGARIFFKRDELNHTGSHKINNCIGQVLLAKQMGKTRVIAETGAGQHGVAVATVAALMGLECIIFMGEKDIKRQKANVDRINLLGAKIVSCTSGSASLKDAMNEALRDWIANVNNTYYLIGTTAGPHPYPLMVREFQKIIGEEVREQLQEQNASKPNCLVAAIGGGSNSLGLFYTFLEDKNVKLIGIEAGGKGLDTNQHGASLTKGHPGILHGNLSYYLQDDDGQISEAHSISAGLDYPGVGPEHAWLKSTNRVEYQAVQDNEALDALLLCSRTEGIIPALEPSHALAYVGKIAPKFNKDYIIVVNICGRGDKDMDTISTNLKLNS